MLDADFKPIASHAAAAQSFITLRFRRPPGSDTVEVSLNGSIIVNAAADRRLDEDSGRTFQLGDGSSGGSGAGVVDYVAINADPPKATTPAPASRRSRSVGAPSGKDGWRTLDVRDGKWSFVGGGPWGRGYLRRSAIVPPSAANRECLALSQDTARGDVEIEFEFRLRDVFGSTSVVFRARDAHHYYLVHFPMIGQQQRAKHFWAAVSKVGDAGWVEVLGLWLVPGVPSEFGDLWHKARVVARGDEIRVVVDGRPLPAVRDDTYQSGLVGLESWSNSSKPSLFRNVRVRGKSAPAPAWDAAVDRPRNWFHPYPGGSGAWQHALMCMTRAPNNDLLMIFADGDQLGLSRSTDDGRTWSQLDPLGAGRGDSVIHTTGDGRLLMQRVVDQKVSMARSTDNGHTWSDWTPAPTGPWPEGPRDLKTWSPSPLVELDDGTLVRFLLGGHPTTTEGNVFNWGSYHAVAYSMRSTDGGTSWSSPVTLDGPPGSGLNLDLTEPVATQLPDGRVVCYIRPIYSPFVWETRSTDRGESWSPTARGPFPSYACSLICTKSGVLVLAGRFPGQGVHVSHDGGMTWRSYRIDETVWANGTLVEVEPDVVLCVYMTKGRLRAQFIRITPVGAEPGREHIP